MVALSIHGETDPDAPSFPAAVTVQILPPHDHYACAYSLWLALCAVYAADHRAAQRIFQLASASDGRPERSGRLFFDGDEGIAGSVTCANDLLKPPITGLPGACEPWRPARPVRGQTAKRTHLNSPSPRRRGEGEASAQWASGSGRSWKCTAMGFMPLPPSCIHGARSPLEVHSPRPFQPAFGSSMRPSRPLA